MVSDRIAYEDLEFALRRAVPEFGPAIDEHLADYDELLPHVLFGDLTRFVIAAYERGDGELVPRALTFLDQALTHGDEAVTNVVAVSFVENVQPWERAMQPFISTWPPALRAEAKRQTN